MSRLFPQQKRTTESIANSVDLLYRKGATKWDIGRAQHCVKRLVALDAVKGHVLDPGCGMGYHSVVYAEKGLRVTAVDASPTALTYAGHNARMAGVSARIEFLQRDATQLPGVADSVFDTVVDSAFFHTFVTDPTIRAAYAQTLARVTKPGGRLFIFGFGPGHINSFANPAPLTEPDFDVLDSFDIDYLGHCTYEVDVRSVPQYRQLPDGYAHIPMWELHATRH